VAGCGVTRYGKFRQGGQGAARSVGVRCGMAVEVCQGQARSGAVGQGGQGTERPVKAGVGGVWQGGYGQSWSAKVRSGVVRRSRCGTARLGMSRRSWNAEAGCGLVGLVKAVEVCRGQVWSGGFRSGEAV